MNGEEMMPAFGLGELGWEELREALRSDPVTDWYSLGYDLYAFEDAESYRRLLAARLDFGRLEILAFIGLWCGDCQEHVPALARILDEARFPSHRVRAYLLDRAKSFPGSESVIARHRVTRLPTFILLKDGAEIGRITETPDRSLIADLAGMLS